MSQDPVVIVEALRTPIGAFQGKLNRISAPELGAITVRAITDLTKIDPVQITEVMMGCVLTAGLGQAPARQVVRKAGLSDYVGATTINKVCGSGMKAVMLAHDQIVCSEDDVLIAGGMENMSRTPHLLLDARGEKNKLDEAAVTPKNVTDHLFLDGLEDAYQKGASMGLLAEQTADTHHITRKDQDAFAKESLRRAQDAQKNEKFQREMIPITLGTPAGEVNIDADECVEKAKPEKIDTLKPAFKEEGTITAATASSIADGAAALLLMRASKAKALGLPIRAKILAHAHHAQSPDTFAIAPIEAIQKVVKKAHWTLKNVDLFEINEAFAVVPLAVMKALGLSHEKVNIHGGACAMGHPIGASGARILVTLLNALEQTEKKRGVAAVCIGGGEATAVAIELVTPAFA